jgi:KDO transferase-3
METIEQHLRNADSEDFLRRRRLARLSERFPKPIRKLASHTIWGKAFKHLRHFDRDYSFVRNETGIASMSFRGETVASFVPLAKLVGMITKPVSLVTLGPSAKTYDWETLKQSGRMIVAVSGGATFLTERGITPDLLVVSDPDFSKAAGYHLENAPGVPLVIELRAVATLHAHFPQALKNRRITVVERVNKWFGVAAFSKEELAASNKQSGSPFWISEVPDKLGRIGWSDRPDLGFFPSTTVALVALQVIVALGGNDIEIIGMDLGGGNSAYTDTGPSKLAEQYQTVLLPSFEIMSRALANRGVTIRNLSPTSPLPASIFPTA